ncbi:hypothetical protein, partial [Vibrio parahaemolyticus]
FESIINTCRKNRFDLSILEDFVFSYIDHVLHYTSDMCWAPSEITLEIESAREHLTTSTLEQINEDLLNIENVFNKSG